MHSVQLCLNLKQKRGQTLSVFFLPSCKAASATQTVRLSPQMKAPDWSMGVLSESAMSLEERVSMETDCSVNELSETCRLEMRKKSLFHKQRIIWKAKDDHVVSTCIDITAG